MSCFPLFVLFVFASCKYPRWGLGRGQLRSAGRIIKLFSRRIVFSPDCFFLLFSDDLILYLLLTVFLSCLHGVGIWRTWLLVIRCTELVILKEHQIWIGTINYNLLSRRSRWGLVWRKFLCLLPPTEKVYFDRGGMAPPRRQHGGCNFTPAHGRVSTYSSCAQDITTFFGKPGWCYESIATRVTNVHHQRDNKRNTARGVPYLTVTLEGLCLRHDLSSRLPLSLSLNPWILSLRLPTILVALKCWHVRTDASFREWTMLCLILFSRPKFSFPIIYHLLIERS